MIRTQGAALAQSVARFSEEIMLDHKGSDGSPAEDALGVTGSCGVSPCGHRPIQKSSGIKKPATGFRRGLNSCEVEHMPVICPSGPALVTGAPDAVPSGIATYSQAGAQFGYGLLWTVFLTTPFMIAIQLVSARIGRVTGKGLAANVIELAPRWLVLALVFLLVAANTANIAADIAAMGESLSLVIGGLNHEHALIFASASTLLQVFVPYRRYAPVLKFLTLTLFAYVATALTVNIPWSAT